MKIKFTPHRKKISEGRKGRGGKGRGVMYIEDIFNNYLKRRDIGIDDTYMSRQPHLNYKMRTILIQWLSDVKRLPHEVIFMSVMLIDKFLEKKVVLRQKLQLLGIMALRLAIKYESRNNDLVIDECIHLCDNAYTREECREMEMVILNVLNYNLVSSVHSYTFLTILLEYDDDASSEILKDFASNVLLLLLPKRMLLKYLPSKVASAVIYVSRKKLMLEPFWTKKLITLTNYSVKHLRLCIDRIGKENLDYNAIKKKTS